MINKAILLATKAHQGQFRKGSNTPYILHPLEAGIIASKMTDNEAVIAAAILHDVLEDTEITEEVLLNEFGTTVTNLVKQESEDKSKTWIERKSRTISSISNEADLNVLMVALSDKLSNIRAMHKDYKELGDQLWERFNMKDSKMQGWYYKALADGFSQLKDYPQYEEYYQLVCEVFGHR